MILVDAHVVVWLAFDETRLSKKAQSTIDNARQKGEGLAISDITLWEVATVVGKGRIELGAQFSLESFLAEIEVRFVIFPITSPVCVRALGLPATYPKDPADRIIAATALVEGLPLLKMGRSVARERFPRSGKRWRRTCSGCSRTRE